MGQKYYLAAAGNIDIYKPQSQLPARTTKEFSLYFPPVPKNTRYLRLIEEDPNNGTYSSDWQFEITIK